MSGRLHAVLLVVVALLAVPVLTSTLGCETVSSVKDWTVGFATEVGGWVAEKGTTFAAAVERAWTAFWGTNKISNVIPDENNALQGVYDGVLRCKADWNRIGDEVRDNFLEISLDHPRMVRATLEATSWKLAPNEIERIEEMREQLMRAE